MVGSHPVPVVHIWASRPSFFHVSIVLSNRLVAVDIHSSASTDEDPSFRMEVRLHVRLVSGECESCVCVCGVCAACVQVFLLPERQSRSASDDEDFMNSWFTVRSLTHHDLGMVHYGDDVTFESDRWGRFLEVAENAYESNRLVASVNWTRFRMSPFRLWNSIKEVRDDGREVENVCGGHVVYLIHRNKYSSSNTTTSGAQPNQSTSKRAWAVRFDESMQYRDMDVDAPSPIGLAQLPDFPLGKSIDDSLACSKDMWEIELVSSTHSEGSASTPLGGRAMVEGDVIRLRHFTSRLCMQLTVDGQWVCDGDGDYDKFRVSVRRHKGCVGRCVSYEDFILLTNIKSGRVVGGMLGANDDGGNLTGDYLSVTR